MLKIISSSVYYSAKFVGMKLKNSILLLILTVFSVNFLAGQEIETIPPNYIRTIQLIGESENNSGNPVINLGGDLQLSFDDIIGDEADYYYKIEYFNFDWTPTQLAQNEFMEGFDNVRIQNYQNAYNTLQPYTHYELSIPNQNTKALKVSGNYILKVFNSEKELVFSRKFMIRENLALVQAEIKRSRDLNFINEKQVVNFSVNSPDLLLKNPEQNVKVIVWQNYDLHTAISDLVPQYTIANELIYRYDTQSSFWGGNEYLMFDNKELRATTADISSVELNELYHHYLFPDLIRNDEPYTYNPDINGGFRVRNYLAQNSDTEAEYVWIHFRLKDYDPIGKGEIHIFGGFNNFTLDNSTKLTYNDETGFYEGARLFKQGFYNYKYVLKNPDGSIDPGFVSGNFDETENRYDILVYYRPPGGRYDRIIGQGTANSRNIRN